MSSESTSSTPSAIDTPKNLGIIGIVKSLLLLGTCFGVSLFKTHSHMSPHFILDKINHLSRDLSALEHLKRENASDEIELTWDKQRIAELEHKIMGMREGFQRTADDFHHHKESLETENKLLKEAMTSSTQFDKEQRSGRVSVTNMFSDDLAKTHGEVDVKKNENEELRILLTAMRGELEKQKGLRGNQRKDAEDAH